MIEKPKKTDIAWFAGMLDGEGYIGIILQAPHKNRARELPIYRLTIEITSTHLPTIEKIKSIWQVGRVTYRDRSSINAKWHPSWRWDSGSNAAAHILSLSLPYLCTKKAKAEIAIAFQKRKATRTIQYRGGWNKRIPVIEFEGDRKYAEALKGLSNNVKVEIEEILDASQQLSLFDGGLDNGVN
ncbi:hypothetical protein KKE60_07470 [Patescibacteria group bacterium]|nr:hypothetical protein [Patescibacteria group bacterium]